MKNTDNHQSIKCSVKTCVFHRNNRCTLTEIEVGSVNKRNTHDDRDTLCKSFEDFIENKK